MTALLFAALVAGAPPDASALLERFECARCHAVPGVEPAPTARHCVRCHEDIHAGRVEVPQATLHRWQAHVKSLLAAPDLRRRRLDAAWLKAFLLAPVDVRPDLPATMPRLAITAAEAETLAGFLAAPGRAPVTLDESRIEAGAAAFATLGCGACHAFGGLTEAPPPLPHPVSASRSLAPDLARTRDRMAPAEVVAWLLDPGPLMPRVVTERETAEALAAFVVLAPLPARAPPPAPRFLPVLKRKVAFGEVWTEVLSTVCWHCHSAEDFAFGDGGPGNTGGFGFEAPGLDVSSYAAISRGMRGPDGRRRSVLSRADGPSRLVRALKARWSEVRGEVDPEVRGMPLGLLPLSLEQIQLVESWVAQGRPR